MKKVIEMEELILDVFRKSNCKAGEIIMKKTLKIIYRNLNPEEKKLFDETLENLISEDFISYDPNEGICLRLGQKGYDRIY